MNTDMKYIFIINPAAGTRTRQAELLNQIRTTLPSGSYELHFTSCEGDGTRIAAECIEQHHNENIVLFACGGDGTFFEVINGAAGRVPVGVFPCGSGNDFIKNIVSPQNLLDVSAQINGQAVPLDLIRCNGNYVSNVCNIGFDADIAYNMNRFRKIPFLSGKKAYIAAVVYCFFHRMRYPLNIEIDDGQPVTGEFLFTVIANGQTYGGSFRGAPEASVHDGLIDICLCRRLSRLTLLRYVSAFQKGTYLKKKGIDRWVDYRKCRKVRITMPEPTVTGYDGNIARTSLVEAEIIPAAMQLIIPQGATLK
ncbi:MAG: hypothetical protein E7195_03770 [Peptococcaceae bacterium]|nr:hypothetical protein [Peptococcaceae bacterium]